LKRELTKILTVGTLVDEALINSFHANYLLAIKEDNEQFGICFVDTSTGQFNLAQFEDDKTKSQFQTLLIQLRPKEIIYEKVRLKLEGTTHVSGSVQCSQHVHR